MKSLFVLPLLLLVLGAEVTGATAASPDGVQAELEAILALTRQRPPEGTTGADHYRWFDGLTRRLGAEAFAFMERHPVRPPPLAGGADSAATPVSSPLCPVDRR
jgi:hypothetical protein